MELHESLLFLFPDFKHGDWVVKDDKNGVGQYIAEWNRTEPQPPQGRIAAVTVSQRDNAKRDRAFNSALNFGSKKDRAIISWVADKLGITYAEALTEIKAIWDAM